MSSLPNLISDLASGKVKVVDLTQPLEPDTPVIALPEMFAQSPGLSMEQISRYDDAGPAWYWNTITLGEHTGTHFDAPVHWVTGKDLADNTTDTIPASQLVAPANVIDVSEQVAQDESFLLEPSTIEAWEAKHGAIEAGSWVLLRTDWSKRKGREAFLNLKEEGLHHLAPLSQRYKHLWSVTLLVLVLKPLELTQVRQAVSSHLPSPQPVPRRRSSDLPASQI